LRRLRRSRFFPRTIPDRRGEDLALGSARFDATVMVYFPGALDTTYQITPWLPTFEALHRVHPVVVVCQDSCVAAMLRERSSFPVVTIARYGTLDGVLSRSDVKLALYVSHLPRNFESLRFSSILHAYIGHGDSDKGVSASNQLKAYDFVFAPGQAAIDRIERRLMRFDAAEHCRIVGQPLTLSAPLPAEAGEAGGGAVLYAPTWEGAQPSVAYSSVASHGERLVRGLIADGRYSVIYRPHPLIGVTSPVFAVADRAIREAIEAAGAPHRVVAADAEPLESTFARASALVCDISAVATAWLPSLKPLVITTSAGPDAVAADSGMLSAVPRLPVADAGRAADVVAAESADGDGRDRRRQLVGYYLSPYWPDGVMDRFVAVCGEVIAERDVLRRRLVEAGATGV
ncbi:MAG: CDP-glycerol glycerophosphotransferase family protein, partial [Amnibacterium sp.]